jgi:hypothetical protein
MNQNDKFEADISQVKAILDRTKADLMNLLPEFDTLEAALAAKNGNVGAAAAPDDSKPAENPTTIPRSHFGWFHFHSHKSQ